MKLFRTTLLEYPEGHHSNLATAKMIITPDECAERFKQSKTAKGFAGRLQKLIHKAQLQALRNYLDEID